MKRKMNLHKLCRCMLLSGICIINICTATIALSQEAIKIEARVDTNQVLIKQQLLLVATIHHNGELIDPELPPPEVASAIVMQAGKVKTHASDIPGYSNAVTIQWAIFPLSEGELIIPSLHFSARVQENKPVLDLNYLPENRDSLGVSQRVHVSTFPKKIRVQADNKALIKCRSLSINTQWSQTPYDLHTGQTVQHTVILKAVGLPAELLPSVPIPAGTGYRVSLISTDSENASNSSGITSKKTIVFAIIPTSPGHLNMEGFLIKWWNTIDQQINILKLPPQQLTIKSAAQVSGLSTDNTYNKIAKEPEKSGADKKNIISLWLFYLISATLVIVLSAFIYKSQQSPIKREEKKQWRQLKNACLQNDLYQVRQSLLQWMHTKWVQQLMHPSLKQALKKRLAQIDEALYAKGKCTINTSALIKQLIAIRKKLS